VGCCNFGREDENFPFEEEALRFTEGILPQWNLNRELKVVTRKEEAKRRIESLRNALIGFPEEEKLSHVLSLLEREVPEENREKFMFIVERYLIPFSQKLLIYRINSEGSEELEFLTDEILRELSTFKRRLLSDRIEIALNVLVGALYQQLEGNDD